MSTHSALLVTLTSTRTITSHPHFRDFTSSQFSSFYVQFNSRSRTMAQHATQRMIKPNGLPQQAIVSISPWVWSRPGRLLSFGALPINGTEADEAEAVVDITRGPCVLAHVPTS